MTIPAANLPQPGDVIRYYGSTRSDVVSVGTIARREDRSPVTGNPRYFVVDPGDNYLDPVTGRWVPLEDVVGIDAPVTPE
jgi:hypothetical protein